MTTYFCKRFVVTGKGYRGHWEGLGVVRAASSGEAWTLAVARWGHVNSVYPLDFCD